MRWTSTQPRDFTGRALRAIGAVVLTAAAHVASAATALPGCFEQLEVPPADNAPVRALYLFVDETTPLAEPMKARVAELVADWGRAGDVVKIARFAANMNGRHPELVFSASVDRRPSEDYLFNLRYAEKAALLSCFEKHAQDFRQQFRDHLAATLNSVDPKLPKTDLLHALRALANDVILIKDAPEKTVLLVSDGLENSGLQTFYKGRAAKRIDPKSEIATARKHRLIANWKGASVYMYGIGLNPNGQKYLPPQQVDALKNFWERYFVEGNAMVRGMGTPELLVTAIR